MKKILFATPYKSTTGGISQWASHIVNYYEASGRNDCLLEILPMNDVKKGRSTIGMSFRQRVIYGLQTYSHVVSQLKKTLKATKYDILHISSSASLSLVKDLWMINVARRHSVKTIVHFHFGRIPALIKNKGWEYKLLMKVIRKATQVIVMDAASYNSLKGIGVKNVTLVPNPLSSQVEEAIKSNKDVRRHQNTVLFVGHVVKTKGIFELVEACRDIDNIRLRVVGPVQPEVKSSLLELTNNREFIDFVGTVPLEQVIKEMLSCGVFVLPTYSEGFPNVIIESMACGCPIVTTPVGAIPEMLAIDSDNPCGICVEVRNVEELKNAIQTMLSDSKRANEMGELAKARVRGEYAMDVIWSQLTSIWETI